MFPRPPSPHSLPPSLRRSSPLVCLQANHKSVDINVFSLSLLLSSHQILNLQGSITAMDLEMLQMFSEFANHAVARLQRKGTSRR